MKALFLIPFLILALNSCTKQVAGPKGDPGTPAKKGNLKQSQRTITVPTASWSFIGGVWVTSLSVPEISNDVVMKGEVKVYMKVETVWWSLPYAVENIFMKQKMEPGILHLELMQIHGGPPPAPNPTDFRIVTFAPAN